MKRLTGWDGDRAYILGLKPFEMPVDEEVKIRAVVERLAAYEDIGLEPNTLVDEIPAEDVRPVVRGRWIFDRGDLATCSNCGSEILKRDVRNHKFCHYCGADMRKEDGYDRDL